MHCMGDTNLSMHLFPTLTFHLDSRTNILHITLLRVLGTNKATAFSSACDNIFTAFVGVFRVISINRLNKSSIS